jgi:hypothetical protein
MAGELNTSSSKRIIKPYIYFTSFINAGNDRNLTAIGLGPVGDISKPNAAFGRFQVKTFTIIRYFKLQVTGVLHKGNIYF